LAMQRRMCATSAERRVTRSLARRLLILTIGKSSKSLPVNFMRQPFVGFNLGLSFGNGKFFGLFVNIV